MNPQMFLSHIIKKLQNNADIQHHQAPIYNHALVECSLPYIDIQILSAKSGVGQKTVSIVLSVKVVSDYRGDAELQALVAAILKELTTHAFKIDQDTAVVQGRLHQHDCKINTDGRIHNDHLELNFFIKCLI